MLNLDVNNLKAVFFDFEGTIIDTEELHYLSYQKTLQTIGIEFSSFEDHIKNNNRQDSTETIINEFQKNNRTIVGIEELVELKKSIFTRLIISKGIESIPGIVELLYKLKNKNKKLGLISNSKYEGIITILNKAAIPNIFDVIISREHVQNLKPEADSYLIALDRLQLKSNEVVTFENDLNGLLSAQNANIKTYGFQKYLFSEQIKQNFPNIESITNFNEVKIN